MAVAGKSYRINSHFEMLCQCNNSVIYSTVINMNGIVIMGTSKYVTNSRYFII